MTDDCDKGQRLKSEYMQITLRTNSENETRRRGTVSSLALCGCYANHTLIDESHLGLSVMGNGTPRTGCTFAWAG
jgi:hypothetical protein